MALLGGRGYRTGPDAIANQRESEVFRRLLGQLQTRIEQLEATLAAIEATIAALDHGGLVGLSDDDHAQYALLAGRSGGQTLVGGTASGEDLTLQSTAHATKGSISFGTSAYDEANNRLGIGTTTPRVEAEVAGRMRTTATGTTPTTGAGVEIAYRTSDGVGRIFAYDRDASADKPLEIEGSTVDLRIGGADAFSITSGSAALAVSPTGGLGYGAGAGGTVAQATSKATGVTINKVCGQITTHNATLNAGVEVAFRVTNSTVAATDVPHIVLASGGATNAYAIQVSAVGAGYFDVMISNLSAVNLSETLVLNFAVIKAVTA